MGKGGMILIDWVDSYSSSGWKGRDELEVTVANCQSVGFLVNENESAVVIALSRTTEDGFKPFGHLLTIPKCSIRRRKRL